jgi:protein ImuA
MSPRPAEGVAFLRRAIAALEAHGPSRAMPARLALTPRLDPMLGGGLAGDGLHEIAPAGPGDGAAAMGFALALGARFLAAAPRRTNALLILDDFCARETGALYGPGLAAMGLAMERLIIVRAADAPALLWAMEEALKSGAPAFVIGEMWGGARHYGLAASRRLLLAARGGGAPALLVHGGAFGRADDLSSAAETRFEIAYAPSAHAPSAAGRGLNAWRGLPLPGPPAFALRLLKARLRPGSQAPPAFQENAPPAFQENAPPAFRENAPPFANFDETKIIRLEWNSAERCFLDPTISLPLVRTSADGPGARAAAR